MFVTVKKCGGQGECIKSCPTEAIRYIEKTLPEYLYNLKE